MAKRDIIVIGASAGGVRALTRLVSLLPAQLSASVFVVLHITPLMHSVLPEILSRAGPLPACHPNGARIEPGRIYVAPPNHHMLLDSNRVELSTGPKENRHRPAINPLFRSAAENFGERVIGVILTGYLEDGALGLWEIKQHGGITIVQDPAEAAYPDMPRNALAKVAVDFILPLDEIAAYLATLTTRPVSGEADRRS